MPCRDSLPLCIKHAQQPINGMINIIYSTTVIMLAASGSVKFSSRGQSTSLSNRLSEP